MLLFHILFSEHIFLKYASEKYKLELFTQEDFCCKTKGDYSFWLRISCAECAKTFEKKFEKIN